MTLTIFDQICYQFETIATGGVPQIRALVMATFWMLATIDACMAFLTNLDDGDHFKIMIQKCLKIGFWLFLLNSWGIFLNVIKDSFIMVGSVMGSGAGVEVMQHPSQIVSMGVMTLQPIIKFEAQYTGWTRVVSNLGMVLAGVFAYLFGCLAYVILGIQVVVTYIEFYLVCALLTVFVPFGVTKWTSFLAEKAIGGVIAYGVKLMTLSCVVSIIPDVINAYAPGTLVLNLDNALTAMVSLVAVAFMFMFLAWQAPALAASVMTGGPSFTAGNLAGFTAAAALVVAGGTAAAAKGASAVAGMAASGGASAGKSSAAAAASQMNNNTSTTSINNSSTSSTGGSSSQSSPTFSNGGTSSYGGGGSSSGGSSAGDGSASNGGSSSGGGAANGGNSSAGGSSSAAGASKSGQAGTAGSAGAAGGVSGSSPSSSPDMAAGGETGGASTSAGSSSGGSPGNSSASPQGNSNTGAQNKSPSFSEAVTKMSMLRGAIPQEASPKGGMSAPIRD
jgi:type IV secretion system protein TrbL